MTGTETPAANPLTVVLVLDHAAITGGQAKVAFDSAIALRRRGHRAIVFAAAGEAEQGLIDAGVEVHTLGQSDLVGNSSRLGAAVQGMWNRKAARALGTLLQSLPARSTIVHVHGWAKALSPSIAAPIRASGLPAIYTMHEFFLHCPNGGFYDHRAAQICKRNPLSASCIATNCDSRHYAHKLWRVARQIAVHWPARMHELFRDVIYISKMQREIIAPLTQQDVRLHHLPNPVDARDMGPKQAPASGDMIFAGRLSAEKGPLLFAEAARKAGIAPVFIGDGPLEEQVRSACPQARMTGWMSSDELRQAMRNARALVFPSVWYETFGLTAYEALAAGTPVIVSDCTAAREAVRDGHDGLWFRSGDADDLAAKLRAMMDDAFCAAASRNAYEGYWRSPLTADRHVDGLLALYEDVLARRGVSVRHTQRKMAQAAGVAG